MNMLARATLFAALLAWPAVFSDVSAKPGFACKKGISQIERAICNWGTVGTLDGRMAKAFRQALAAQEEPAARKTLQAGQRAWLAARNRRCALDAVKPVRDSEEGLTPQEYGQLFCLQAIYPPRIAALIDAAAPPLVPETVTTLPNEALRAAYPDNWQQLPYQAQFSPDGAMLLLMVSEVVSANTASFGFTAWRMASWSPPRRCSIAARPSSPATSASSAAGCGRAVRSISVPAARSART